MTENGTPGLGTPPRSLGLAVSTWHAPHRAAIYQVLPHWLSLHVPPSHLQVRIIHTARAEGRLYPHRSDKGRLGRCHRMSPLTCAGSKGSPEQWGPVPSPATAWGHSGPLMSQQVPLPPQPLGQELSTAAANTLGRIHSPGVPGWGLCPHLLGPRRISSLPEPDPTACCTPQAGGSFDVF